MVGIDPQETGVQADGAFEQRDQTTDRSGFDARDGQSDRLAIVVKKGFARTEQKSVEVIARGDAGFYFQRWPPGLEHADENDKEVGHALAQLLNVRVLIG